MASSSFEIARENSAWKGFWNNQMELDDPKYRCPQPCKHAERCVYDGPGGCGFVHPGEQGTGRKLMAGRYVKTATTKQWENETVRLSESSFYERRRLRLSWPQWCERQGLPAPVPLSKMPKPQPWQTPPKKAAKQPAAPAKVPQEAHPYSEEMMAWVANMQQQYMAQNYQELLRRRNAIGDKLFYVIKDQLEKTVADRKEANLDHPKITPGLITGMLLENDLNEAEKLITDADGLGERMIEACEAIIEKFGI
jgi:hypothetical protein